MKKIIISIILAVLLLGACGSSQRNLLEENVTCTIQPTESASLDAMISKLNLNTNYATHTDLGMGGNAGGANVLRTLIAFDDFSCVAGSIVSAQLHITQKSEASSKTTIVSVYEIPAWDEATVTWATQPEPSTLVSSRSFSASEANGDKVFELDIASVQRMKDGEIFGYLFRADTEVSDLYVFHSASGSTRPSLVIVYSPGTPTASQTPSDTHTPTITLTPSLTPISSSTPVYTPIVPASSLVIPENLRGELALYALMGQSNMSGRGIVPGSQTTGTVWNFRNSFHWVLAVEPVDATGGEVDVVSSDPPNAGYSPALSFGLEMGSNIGLVPCAKGGSSISEWQRSFGDDTLYGSCWKRILAASQMGDLEGILFFQGESDADTEAEANLWAYRFTQFVSAIRSDFGNIPIVFAQLGGPATGFAYWNTVKDQQASIDLACVEMITTDDLPNNNGHFFTAGYIVIGERFAEKMMEMDCE